MIEGLKAYAEYKDSGLPWLGKVPSHWREWRLDRLFELRKETPLQEDQRVTGYLSGRVTLRTNVQGLKIKGVIKDGNWQRVHPGDFAISGMNAHLGGMGVSDSLGKCSPIYLILKPKPGTDAHFVSHAVRHIAHTGALKSFVNTIRFNSADFKRDALKLFRILLPVEDEASAIVAFIDHASGQIERAIQAKRKLIALLNEQKHVIIHRAVTRGLDPKAPLNPSGIPWLGDIPKHWGLKKLKYEVSFCGGGTPTKANLSYWNGNIPWVSPKDMKSDVITDAEDHITERAIRESSTNLVPEGSLLMVVRSGILQRTIPIARCTRAVALNQDMKALTATGELGLDYLAMLIRGCEKRLIAEWTKQGATVESIEHKFLANSKVPIPSATEQQLIVNQVSEECKPLTTAIHRTEREIALLREYRTRLIADVVTGKVDVREAARQLPATQQEIPVAADVEELEEEAAA